MQLLTIASRANLGESISNTLTQSKKQLDEASEFLSKVEGSIKLSKEQKTYHLSSSLMGACGFVEAGVNSAFETYLVAYPGHCSEKSFTLNDLASSGSVVEIVRGRAKNHIKGLSYERFSEYSNSIWATMTKKKSPQAVLVDTVSEIKATRDIYAHGGGKVNSTYLDKSGEKARNKSIGRELKITYKYVLESVDHLRKYVESLEADIPEKILSHGKTETLQEMWNSSVLNRCMSFDEAWVIKNSMVEGANFEKQGSYGWSSSEKALVNFFIDIYYGIPPDGEHYDFTSTLRQWSWRAPESKILKSWLETPFWF